MTLASKIAAASKAVGGRVKADKRNLDQSYDYISADAILAFGGQALAEQGVTIYPAVLNADVETIAYKEGKLRYDARITYLMRVADDADAIELAWIGMGSDYMTPDKALYKAVTSGHKYFLAKLLNIGEGNEDGEHEAVEVSEKATVVAKSVVSTGPVPNCPKCGGPMWDNRESNAPKNAERAKQGKNALPDFKCRNKDCDGVVWPPRDNGTGAQSQGESASADGKATDAQKTKIHVICGKLYKTPEQVATYRAWLKQNWNVDSSKDLTVAEASKVIELLSAEEARAEVPA